MFQIDNSTAVAVKPTPEAAGTPGYFTNGDPVGGVPATVVEADFLNMVQDELIAILTAAGITPDKAASNQVLLALQALGLKIATTAQAQALSDDATIITPKKLADVLGGGAIATNGYGEIPLVIGGLRKELIVQWGFESQSGNAMFSATFPIAFPTACLTLVMANYTGSAVGTGPFPFVCPIGGFTATGFNYQQSNSATTGAYNMSYIAIGH